MKSAKGIVVQGLRRTFGRVVAVERVDLAVAPGELVVLVGHNGAGKTTTLRVLTGELPPTEGSVHVDGIDVHADPGTARRRLGYVPEFPLLFDHLTAREFLELVAALRGEGDVEDALDFAGLGQDADRLVREYSQGMRRRTALAAAVMARPPVLVLDEALNGLDPPAAARVRDRLLALRDAGAAILLSTHVLELAERLADRIVVLARGRVVADLDPRDPPPEGIEAYLLQHLGRPE